MAGTLDDLVAALVRGWAAVLRAWIEAANSMTIGLLDLADVETGRPGFNQGLVVFPQQQAPTALQPGPFSDWDQNQLPPAAFTLTPSQISAGEITEVVLLVEPPVGTASGTYTGSLFDPTGTCLLEEVGVYVVGDKSP